MSGLDQLLRLQKWTLDEKRRQAADLAALIERLNGDIANLDADLERQIEAARNDIEAGRQLPAYRELVQDRRQKLERSIIDVTAELNKVRDEIAAVFSEIKEIELTIQNRQARKRRAEERREQTRADEIGASQHQRNKKPR